MSIIERWEELASRRALEGQEWIIRADEKEFDEWLIP